MQVRGTCKQVFVQGSRNQNSCSVTTLQVASQQTKPSRQKVDHYTAINKQENKNFSLRDLVMACHSPPLKQGLPSRALITCAL